MYPDPKRVRNNRVIIRLDDYEFDLIKSIAVLQGNHTSTTARELLMSAASRILEPEQKPSQQ